MNDRLIRRAWSGAVFVMLGLGAAAPAAAPRFAGLAPLELGRWQFHEPGAGPRGPNLCVMDAAVLLQLGHPGARCAARVLTDGNDGVTVHYTCPGTGHGHTALTIETPRLIHVKTEGIASGVPFDYDYEGRRVGACAPR